MRRVAWTLAGMIAVGALGGCGGGNGFSTDVPATAIVQDLPPSGFLQLCEDVNSYVTQQLDSPRLSEAGAVIQTANKAMVDPTLTDAQLQQSCEKLVPTISPSLPAAGGPFESMSGSVTVCTLGSACTATVAQVSACLNDTGAALSTFEQMVPPCGTITRAKVVSLNPASFYLQPASCKPLNTSCPSVAQIGATIVQSPGSEMSN